VQPYDDDDDDDEGLPRSHRLGAAVPRNKLDVDISFTVTWNDVVEFTEFRNNKPLRSRDKAGTEQFKNCIRLKCILGEDFWNLFDNRSLCVGLRRYYQHASRGSGDSDR